MTGGNLFCLLRGRDRKLRDYGWLRKNSQQVGANSQGIDRRPMNLIKGVRSAACAACRTALVAYIVMCFNVLRS